MDIQDSTHPPVDWQGLLRDFLAGGPGSAAAADAFAGVIRGTLCAIGAYERRSSWDDLMNNVLLALFEHGHTVQTPWSWLRRATFNAYVDALRRESSQAARVRQLTEMQAMLEHDDPSVELLASLSNKEEIEALRRAVAALPEEQRCIVDRVYPSDPGQELETLEEVAKSLGIRLHTVKNRLYSAMEKIKRELRRERNLGRFRVGPPPSSPEAAPRARPPRRRMRRLPFSRRSDVGSE